MNKQTTKYYHLYVGSEVKMVLDAIRALCEDRHLNIDDGCYGECDITLSIASNQGPVKIEAGIGDRSYTPTTLLNLFKVLRETNKLAPVKPKFIDVSISPNEGWLSNKPMVSKEGVYVDWYMYRVFKTGVQIVSDDGNNVIGWIPRDEVAEFNKAFAKLDRQ